MRKDLVRVRKATPEAVEEFIKIAEEAIERDPIAFCEANPWALDCPRCGTHTPPETPYCPGCGLEW